MPPIAKKSFGPRKLLVAAIGVATVNYVAAACGGATDGSTNPPTSGNLPSPTAQPDTGPPPTSGNLAGPPPRDAADEGDAADDGGDGGDSGDDGGDGG